jgi:hypothetical protein
MDAGTAENLLQHLPNFAGIYFARDLDKLALLNFPSAFLIFHEQHWIALFIDSDKIEIFDPLGFITNNTLDSLHHFLKIQLRQKILYCSPRVQSANSSNCGKFTVCYLYWRLECQKTLTSFLELFSRDQIENSTIIDTLFASIN